MNRQFSSPRNQKVIGSVIVKLSLHLKKYLSIAVFDKLIKTGDTLEDTYEQISNILIHFLKHDDISFQHIVLICITKIAMN